MPRSRTTRDGLTAAGPQQGRPGKATTLSPAPGDAGLVARLRGGDETAFAELVEAYHGRLVRLARAFVKDGGAAEEVAQETWMGVLRGLDAFEGRASLKTWIFRILVNRAKTRGLRDSRMVPLSGLGDADGASEPAVDPARFHVDGTWADPPEPWAGDTPENLVLQDEARRRLERALEDLPPRQRRVLVLRDIEGLSAEDACNLLELTETNQRVLLHRARSAFHRAVEQMLEAE